MNRDHDITIQTKPPTERARFRTLPGGNARASIKSGCKTRVASMGMFALIMACGEDFDRLGDDAPSLPTERGGDPNLEQEQPGEVAGAHSAWLTSEQISDQAFMGVHMPNGEGAWFEIVDSEEYTTLLDERDLSAGPRPMAGAGEITKPGGYGHYCSMTWPGGGWAYASDTNGNDPCGWLRSQFGGGTIRKAGLYSAAGTNQTVVWCDGEAWGPAIYRGSGNGPLTAAFDASVASGKPNCVMVASPFVLPILERSPASFSSIGTGVDFARDSDSASLNTGWFGAAGGFSSANATLVNFKGHSMPSGFVEDHDGWDWGAAEFTDLFAMAPGKVMANRTYTTSAIKCATVEAAKVKNQAISACINKDFATTAWQPNGNYISYQNSGWDGKLQGELYVRHKVVTSPATYNESFVAGYFHLNRDESLTIGTNVTKNTQLGTVGNGGWTSGPHLHLTMIRETNVGKPATKDIVFAVNGDSCTACPGGSHNFHQYAVDPFGWQAPQNIDPRGWFRTGGGAKDGAMSINLWSSGVAPSVGSWGS